MQEDCTNDIDWSFNYESLWELAGSDDLPARETVLSRLLSQRLSQQANRINHDGHYGYIIPQSSSKPVSQPLAQRYGGVKMNSYEKLYVQAVTTNDTMQEPEPDKSNGNGERLQILYTAHTKGGVVGAQKALEELCKRDPSFKNEMYPHQRWKVYTPEEVKNWSPPKWLIPNLITECGLTLIYGDPGSGKSLYMLYEAALLAQEHPVLYVITEGHPGYRNRLCSWEDIYGKVSPNLQTSKQAVHLDIPEEVETFIEQNRDARYKLVIFDTLINCRFGGDENSSAEVQKAMAGCHRIIEALQTAIVLVHHTSRSGSTPRGSNALDGACDIVVHVKRNGTTITLSNPKNRDFEAFPSRQYKITKTGQGVTVVPHEGDDTEDADTEDLNATERKILQILANTSNPDGKMRSKDIREQTDAPGTTYDDAISRLKRYGFISQDGERKPYFITQAGRDALGKGNTPK